MIQTQAQAQTQTGKQVLATGMIDVSLLAPAGVNPNRLYTTKEAAEILSCPIRTVSHYLKQGVISGQKLGPRNWRISGIVLLKILTKNMNNV